MRSKTEEQRQRLLGAARLLFIEYGYAGSSMAQISARAGGSKQTLYNYFSSKEEVFVAVMMERGGKRIDALFATLDGSHDIRANLLRFGEAFLTLLLDEEVLGFRRMIIGEGAKSNLGALYFEHGPKRIYEKLAAYLSAEMTRGNIVSRDADLAAFHFKGLIEAGPFQGCLEGARGPVAEDEIIQTATAAVDVFLSHYGAAAAGPNSL